MNTKLFVSLFVAMLVAVAVFAFANNAEASTAIFASCRINADGSFACQGETSFSCPAMAEDLTFSEAMTDGSCNYRGQDNLGNNVLVTVAGQ
ncbi:MAG TPA: hypothetical protein PK999_16655 [Nitrospira sp.]|nr:hypothetical protein [Nitrospira sp.]